jgi:hypothetical protein
MLPRLRLEVMQHSDYTGAHFMVPNGKGLDVGVDSNVTVPTDGWAWGPDV